jgi:hypothetical protein
MGGGCSHVATEMTAAGDRVFLLQFPNATLYRTVPIPFGQLSRDALRNGIDVQYPPSAAADTARQRIVQLGTRPRWRGHMFRSSTRTVLMVGRRAAVPTAR